MAQVSLAWLLSKSVVSAPIVGATSLDKLSDLIGEDHVEIITEQGLTQKAGAVHVKLTEEEVRELEEPYKPQAISGHA